MDWWCSKMLFLFTARLRLSIVKYMSWKRTVREDVRGKRSHISLFPLTYFTTGQTLLLLLVFVAYH